MFTAIPLHATCGIVMGYYMGIAKLNIDQRTRSLILSVLFPVIIHGLYDYFIFAGYGIIFSLLILIIAFYFSNKSIKIHQTNSPFKPN